jgi:PIN domain nuclease of toxin-antitoxin system
MRDLLLDTHVVLWWLDDPALISEAARTAIRAQESIAYVSAATVWEIVIKQALGKLDAPVNLDEVLRDCQFSPLPVTVEHALEVRNLPLHHHDPFDRMLVAQTKVEGLTIVTRDSNVLRYAVSHLLA